MSSTKSESVNVRIFDSVKSDTTFKIFMWDIYIFHIWPSYKDALLQTALEKVMMNCCLHFHSLCGEFHCSFPQLCGLLGNFKE